MTRAQRKAAQYEWTMARMGDIAKWAQAIQVFEAKQTKQAKGAK